MSLLKSAERMCELVGKSMRKKGRSRELNTNGVIDIEAARRERRQKRKQSEDIKEPTRRQSTKSIRRRVMFSFVIVLVIVATFASVYNIIALKIERAAAVSQLQSLEKEKEALDEELNKVGGKEYIEQQAREQLKMILPGETLYVLKGNGKDDETTD